MICNNVMLRKRKLESTAIPKPESHILSTLSETERVQMMHCNFTEVHFCTLNNLSICKTSFLVFYLQFLIITDINSLEVGLLC